MSGRVGRFRTVCIVRSLLLLACGTVVSTGCDDDGESSTPVQQENAALSQDRIDAALVAAEKYIDGGDVSKAQAILETLLEQAPNEAGAHELMARIIISRADAELQRGRREEAIARFVEAYGHYRLILEHSPPHAGMAQSAGRVALSAGLHAEALEHFRAAGETDPLDPTHALLEANLLLQMNRLEEARQAIDRARKILPDEPYAMATDAMILKEEGKSDDALALIAEARDLAGPADELAMRVMEAKLRRQAGDPQRALDMLLPLSPDERAQEAVAYEIAESAAALGNHADAIAAWAHRFGMTQDWRAALRASEQAMLAGLKDDAWSWFRRAELMAPSAPEVREHYAKLRASAQTD